MMNMGLERLVLVNPPPDPRNEARKLAAGAESILAHAAQYGSLTDAVADHRIVIGTSRHEGRLRKNVQTPREAVCRTIPLLGRNRAAFVFGNEVNGLEKEHLKLCHEIIFIPSSDAFPSLNLSHAVMIVAYELFFACLSPTAALFTRELATGNDLNHFYVHLQSTLEKIGFFDAGNRERMMLSFRQIFGRALLDERDVSVLRGVLSNIERVVKSCKELDERRAQF
jgi:tRNA/rRNA methyltransferase